MKILCRMERVKQYFIRDAKKSIFMSLGIKPVCYLTLCLAFFLNRFLHVQTNLHSSFQKQFHGPQEEFNAEHCTVRIWPSWCMYWSQTFLVFNITCIFLNILLINHWIRGWKQHTGYALIPLCFMNFSNMNGQQHQLRCNLFQV